MEVRQPRSWNGFIKVINDIRKSHPPIKQKVGDKEITRDVKILFRGQSDSTWPLATTLERASKSAYSIQRYCLIVGRIVNELESHTGRRWNLPDHPDLSEEIRTKQRDSFPYLPAYDLLVYLRHHGFPSPLLDWTESPYIAAYFALNENVSKRSAVFCFIERPNSVKTGWVGDSMISTQGPYVSTDGRHFAQKAWYTIATNYDESKETHTFCSHEDVFKRSDPNQDILYKILLPNSIRAEGLSHLNDYNINHFTLFNSEEALVQALASRMFDYGSR